MTELSANRAFLLHAVLLISRTGSAKWISKWRDHGKSWLATMVGRQEKFLNSRRSKMAKTVTFWPLRQPFHNFCFPPVSPALKNFNSNVHALLVVPFATAAAVYRKISIIWFNIIMKVGFLTDTISIRKQRSRSTAIKLFGNVENLSKYKQTSKNYALK